MRGSPDCKATKGVHPGRDPEPHSPHPTRDNTKRGGSEEKRSGVRMVHLKRLCEEIAELSRALMDLTDVLESALAAAHEPMGLTEPEALQGREPPPGCDAVDPGDGAGYHPGSDADPRD